MLTSAVFAFRAKPGTVGDSAVPPKSPVNLSFPLVVDEASMIPAAVAACTKAVVAIFVVLSPGVCVTAMVPVGKLGVPVNTGEFLSAFASTAACKAMPWVAWSTYVFTALADGYFISELPSVVTLVDLLLVFYILASPGTVGAVAVPAKSPAN